MTRIILLAMAVLLFLLAAVGVGSPRLNLVPLGLALWVLADLVTGWKVP
jgi:hypothetical protein